MGVFGEQIAVIVEQQKKKEQHQKKALTARYKKGMFLFGLDPDTLNVYQVPVEEKKTFVIGDEGKSERKASIHPSHLYVWALNEKNAHRKFRNIVKELFVK
ncbi:hypothetical protein SAMN06296241_1370 [Salinimicrobium sediminis]|uniref:Uncharacterized protein n=1 Tax=Salinimicrobium sediminis TaxID=1343891 RepID=A0A285X3B9_9FLAO|nr:hypothetical protein [Salinimicrobium sediminis]SOC79833.1 hypothetical protein SAMN06296241_1370 [Salinimicrobium sediminis]